MGAAYVWRAPEGWAGRRYHLGTNRKVSNTEIYAIYQALRAFDQRQESGHRHTIFADSTAAVASMEVCTRVFAGENEVAVRWVAGSLHTGSAAMRRRTGMPGLRPRDES